MTRLDAMVEVGLIYPYGPALFELHSVAAVLDLAVLSGGTGADRAVLAIHWRTFKRLFGRVPLRGEYPVPERLARFLNSVRVLGPRVVELPAR